MAKRPSKPKIDATKQSKPLRRQGPSRERHSSRSRDAALRRLRSANRWLIAASAALTGIFTALAATAFSGRTIKVRDVSKTTTPAAKTSGKSSKTTTKHSHRTRPLKASSSPQDLETEGAAHAEEEEGGEVLESGPESEASSTPGALTETETEKATTTTTPRVVEEPVVSGGS